MSQSSFADGIFNVTVAGNLVRIDFGVAELVGKKAGGRNEARMVRTQQVVMPLEGFVRAVGIQEQVLQGLVKSGAVKLQPRRASPAAAPDGKKDKNADA